ncbi:MAG: anaerobic ribonucleoside-triphosphate reductase activating protein [Clostridiales bacterium]|nr:anaerobic ribonucleoside-triphosphate reductase activating protein [Clostridiales bacterium]
MIIHGLQKMTLLDFPGRVACTVFSGGCDFRCPFCHNSELIGEAAAPGTETISEEDFFAFLGKRRGLLDGVAVTGGEPTLCRDLPEFLARIRDMGFAVKLDTNGNHPRMLERILNAGLADYVAMDIKNSPERYGATIGIPDFDVSNISASISLLMNGPADYEFRTTAVEEFHDDRSFSEIAQWIQGAKRYYLQCFVDRDTVLEEGLHAPAEAALLRYADLVRPFVSEVGLRGI